MLELTQLTSDRAPGSLHVDTRKCKRMRVPWFPMGRKSRFSKCYGRLPVGRWGNPRPRRPTAPAGKHSLRPVTLASPRLPGPCPVFPDGFPKGLSHAVERTTGRCLHRAASCKNIHFMLKRPLSGNWGACRYPHVTFIPVTSRDALQGDLQTVRRSLLFMSIWTNP